MTAGELLTAEGIRVRYGALTVLDGVTFAVSAGEAVGIVGPNGAGKTTLLNALAGSLRPADRVALLRGDDVTAMSAAGRCRLGIARSHQVPRPFGNLTVFENVLVGATAGGARRGAEARRRSLDVVDRCGLGRLANRRADGMGLLDRKRLEMARALATGPAVLLLDEIGAGLTDAEADELLEAVRAVREQGVAIVWIEHIVHVLVRLVGRLVCLDAGRVIADGEPDAVMGDAAWRSADAPS